MLKNISEHLLDEKITPDKGLGKSREQLGQLFIMKRSLKNEDIPKRIYSLLGIKFDGESNKAQIVHNRKASNSYDLDQDNYGSAIATSKHIKSREIVI